MSVSLIHEALLVASIAGVGVSALHLAVPRLGLPLTIMFSGLVGVLMVTLTTVITLGLGWWNSALKVAVACLFLVGTSLIVDMRRSRIGYAVLTITASGLIAATVTVGLGLLVAPILTFDSWRFLEHGSSVFGDGASMELLFGRTLGDYPVALLSFQGLGREFGIPFLASGGAAIGVLGIAGAFHAFGGSLNGSRAALRLSIVVVVVVSVAYSAYLTRLQLGYVNSHAMMAGFYSMGIAALFAPATEGFPPPHSNEKTRAVLLGLSCSGLALGRVEGLATVGLVLVAAVAFRGWSRRSLGLIALVGVAVPVIWYGRIATTLEGAAILSPSRLALLIAAATGALLVGVVSKPASPVLWLAPVTLLSLGGAVLLVAMTNNTGLRRSAGNLLLNLVSTGLWGAIWWVVIPISVMAVSLLQRNERSVWLVLTLGYVLVVLLLGGVRDIPFFARWGDSGNRMMIHVLPVFLLLIFRGFGRSEGDTKVVVMKGEAA